MTQFYKNGIIKTGQFIAPDSTLLNTFTSESYTPTTDNNSCMEKSITGFEKNKSYVIELLVFWRGFKTSVASNFDIFFQGSNYNGTEWVWTGNTMTSSLNTSQNLKTLVLSADVGSKFLRTTFSTTYQGLQLGCRSNYSNGASKIEFSNIKIYPAEYSGYKLYNDKIIMNDFIEI